MKNNKTLAIMLLFIITAAPALAIPQVYEPNHFGNEWDNIIKTTTKTPEDEYAIAHSTKLIENKFSKTLSDVKINDNLIKATALKDLGTLSQIKGIQGVSETSNSLAWRILQGEQGAIYEAAIGAKLHKEGNTIEWMGQKVPIPSSTVDIDVKFIRPNGQKVGMEVKDIAWQYLKENKPIIYEERINKLEKQFEKLNLLKTSTIPSEKIDIVAFNSKQPITPEVQTLIQKYGVEVITWP